MDAFAAMHGADALRTLQGAQDAEDREEDSHSATELAKSNGEEEESTWLVSELELGWPHLFLRARPDAAGAAAEGVLQMMRQPRPPPEAGPPSKRPRLREASREPRPPPEVGPSSERRCLRQAAREPQGGASAMNKADHRMRTKLLDGAHEKSANLRQGIDETRSSTPCTASATAST